WFLRSSASGAFESARVWFWQTRQRSSSASAMTRFSRSGSAAAGGASLAETGAESGTSSRSATALRTVELFDQRQHFLLHDLRSERTDALVADHALLVDHVSLRHAVDAVIDPDLPVEIVDRELVGVTHAFQPFQPVLAL